MIELICVSTPIRCEGDGAVRIDIESDRPVNSVVIMDELLADLRRAVNAAEGLPEPGSTWRGTWPNGDVETRKIDEVAFYGRHWAHPVVINWNMRNSTNNPEQWREWVRSTNAVEVKENDVAT